MTKKEMIKTFKEHGISFKQSRKTDSVTLYFDNDHLLVIKDFDDNAGTCLTKVFETMSVPFKQLSIMKVPISQITWEVLRY